ncbi:unnamed protein product [Ceutorhynchus assimilis]|uniref:Uncharacterized protein n=1 Tax=Ceutorhynchus assimilis TaxID=467358 RepID=A0A9N9MHT0_9CUCU|nr:unnamed protein product [Ceutorhynchus assimilis]
MSTLDLRCAGFHALTGCDYNPAFFKKGKQRPFIILKKKYQYQEAFMKFGDLKSFTDHDIQQDMFNTIQKFICDVYNVTEIIDVDAARLQLFINSYTVSSVNEKFHRKNIKNFDATNLPPCKSEPLQQFRRANYIASIWNNANTKLPSIFTPENNGWTLKENQYHFNWFDVDQLPAFVSESLQEDTEKAASVDNDGEDDDD